MALAYELGEGITKDKVQAYFWCSLAYEAFRDSAAASFGNSLSAEDLQLLHDRLAASMTAAQIAEAERLVEAWKPTNQAP
jgi:TPR repeat protein